MRFGNKESLKQISYIYLFLLMASLLCLLFTVFELVGWGLFYSVTGFSLLVLLYIFATANYFKYNSFGEKLHFYSKKTIQQFFQKRKPQQLAFNKRKLNGYKIKNYLVYTTLIVYVSASSKKEKYKKTIFNITFLSQRKIKLLKKSLDKVLLSNTTIA